MIRDLRTSRRITGAHAFLLGAALALLALLPAMLPYGGRYVTRGDFIEQQLPFILEARRILRGGLDTYSFSTFLGAPSVGSYAFYTLGSPFVWPLALLPETLIPFGISVMAVLKHAVCALTSFCFLRRVIRHDRLALLGSVLYTFSSFTVVNTQFYHFTEVIAFFPLILLGLEIAMSDRPRPGVLGLFCGINTLTNYYFMLSSALLAAMYFVFRFFSEDWKPYRSMRRVIAVVFECGVGCALAGVLLVPAMWHMLNISRGGDGLSAALSEQYKLSVLLERLRALLMPIESNVVHAYYGDADSWCSTAAYLPVFGMTGALVFAFMQKKQRWLKALLAAMLVCSVSPILCGAFALFTNVHYTRWWYGLSLMLVLATLYALRDVPGRIVQDGPASRRWIAAFIAGSAIVCALIAPFLLPDGMLPDALARFVANRETGAYGGDVFRLLSLALTLLGGGVMLILLFVPMRFRAALALVGLCASMQYAGYIAAGDAALLSGGDTANGGGVYTLSDIAEPSLAALALPEEDGYARIDYSPMLRNYGLLREESALTSFFSLRSSTVGIFTTMANFGYVQSPTVAPPNDSGAIRALLSVSEYHQWPQDAALGDAIPEGFVYSHEENGASVYVNENAVPMGFLQTTCTGLYHQRMDEDTVGEVMLAAVTLSDDDLARYQDRMQTLDVYSIPDWQQSVARLQENSCDTFETNASGFNAHIDANDAGILVFTIPCDKGFSATVDGAPAEIILCDASFMGVWIEPGEHEIVFTYKTRGLALGVAMSAFASLVLAGYVLVCRKKAAAPAAP